MCVKFVDSVSVAGCNKYNTSLTINPVKGMSGTSFSEFPAKPHVDHDEVRMERLRDGAKIA